MHTLRSLAVIGLFAAGCSSAASSDFLSGAKPAEAPAAGDENQSNPEPSDEQPGVTTPKAEAGTPRRDAGSPDVSTPPEPPVVNPIEGAGPVTLLSEGFGETEGPIWRAAKNDLLFSDLVSDEIERFSPPTSFTTFRSPSGRANGLALDTMGNLVACEGENRRVTRTVAGVTSTVADNYQGLMLNAPNDVIVRSDGAVYFTDPNYSVYGTQELSFNGVYRVEAGSNVAQLVADDFVKPNGIALSPDEKTLYVTDESAGFIRAYDVAADGSTSNGRKFADAPHPDGIAVDDDGNLYASCVGGVIVFKPDGSQWGTIAVPHQPANCAFGGNDRKTLFIAAKDSLYKIDLKIPGPP